ncbi:hypothetical protein TSUD_42900 [Trifolium subterraneum]|uniref:Reverse transcriptase zinc-binding domain-containing protein n=1 Tax=Trifolium subterraneum TaxID=3900 RepID=A0A2Z6LHG7_TRISU|nr:hypothetical protein TSUD_42900 [Trifolium subterraneum]
MVAVRLMEDGSGGISRDSEQIGFCSRHVPVGVGDRRGCVGVAHSLDIWLWRSDVDGGYTVRGAYQLMTAQDVVPLDAATGLIWHPQVPLKVYILAWRLLRDRLPTKVNLSYRGILLVGDSLCVSGCGEVESTQHVFLSCSTFGSLWSLVSSWVGSTSVTAQTLSDHFIQFTTSASGTRARRLCSSYGLDACGFVDRAKSQVVQRLSKFFTSYVGQDQYFFF